MPRVASPAGVRVLWQSSSEVASGVQEQRLAAAGDARATIINNKCVREEKGSSLPLTSARPAARWLSSGALLGLRVVAVVSF